MAACLENRIAGQHTVNEQQALEVPVHGLRLTSRAAWHHAARPIARSARARAPRVWKCSVTVQALHMCSRITGSAGCSESFQSPWPYAARAVPGMTRFSDQRERALHVLPDRCLFAGLRPPRVEKRYRLVQNPHSPEAMQVLRQHHQRPEHDIAM